MVGIAQLVERRLVVADVAGSSPVTHPNEGPRTCEDAARGLFMGAAPVHMDRGRSSPLWVAGRPASPPGADPSGRRSHPHRTQVGLDDLSLDGIQATAAGVVELPAELMTGGDLAGQRPTLVVVGSASAEDVPWVHLSNARAKSGSGTES